MLSREIRIINFDNSITSQSNLVRRFAPQIIDCVKFGPLCRLWLNRELKQQIQLCLNPEAKNKITFFGSGDFHHISKLLIGQFTEPVSVIIFDNHPDWDILPPKFGCGSWVNRIIEQPNVLKTVLAGVSSGDLDTFSIQTANLSRFKNNRLEIYPYYHPPSKVFFRNVPQNISIISGKKLFYRKINWQFLKDKDLNNFFLNLMQRLPSQKVYVSIDKDCLRKEYAITNWEEGKLDLGQLLLMLKLIKDNLDIVGLDITGDFSPVRIKGRLKTFCSNWDHPKDYSAKGKDISLINSVNEQTNIKILDLLL